MSQTPEIQLSLPARPFSDWSVDFHDLRHLSGNATYRDLVSNRAARKKKGHEKRPFGLFYPTFLTSGIFHEPFNIVGSLSFGQYKRIIKTKSSFGEGSQFDSLALPGESA